MPDSPRRVLIRGVNWLGDAVMSTPALLRLREALPQSRLTLLAPEKLADLWQGHPAIDTVETFSSSDNPWSVARRLRAGGFEAAMVLPNSPRSALEVWLAGVKERIGLARPGRSWLLTRPITPRVDGGTTRKRSLAEIKSLIRLSGTRTEPATSTSPPHPIHQMHDYLYLVAALGANPEPLRPELAITEKEVKEAELEFLSKSRPQWLASASISAAIVLGLNPGAEYGPAKRWPAENFAAVVRAVSQQVANCVWLAFGGAGEWQVCEDIAQLAGGNVLNLAGKTSLRQLMALLRLCRLVLTNDTGPMHVAAALGTPVVVPFGSTSPELTGPGLPGDLRHRLLKSGAPCAPCFRRLCPIDFRCMTGISPDRVSSSLCELLRSR